MTATASPVTPAAARAGGAHHSDRRFAAMPATLDVVAVVSNPRRFYSRYNLFRHFEEHVKDAGARLTVVELALGDRPFEVTDPKAPCDAQQVQLRSVEELWLKESLINIGISRLPADWKYVAWVDADLQFSRPDWVQETIHQLQHHHFIQMWSHAVDLGPAFEPIQTHTSFCYCYVNKIGDMPPATGSGGYYAKAVPGGPFGPSTSWHPGYAWAATREAIDAVGGLIDTAVLGAADNHMARALVGRVREAVNPGVTAGYMEPLLRWQDAAEAFVKRDIGYVPGTIAHYHHGPKKARKYWDRWRILVDNAFDPATDLRRDWQGLYQVVDRDARQIRLRDQIRAYFAQRNEDSLEV